MIGSAAALMGAKLAAASTTTVKIGYFDQYWPFSYRAAGRMCGVLVDCLDAIAENAGYAIEHHGYP